MATCQRPVALLSEPACCQSTDSGKGRTMSGRNGSEGRVGAGTLEAYPAKWWRRDDGRVVCELCPRRCAIPDGARGFCFVRQNLDGRLVLTTFGRSTGFCVDPIEKKPLFHFYPGTAVLSFGTAGCNLGCKFCQNWDISKSREVTRLSEQALPEEIAEAAVSLGCKSVAYTYNDPVIFAEYAIETAKACRAVGVKSVAVTAGYISPEAREEFFKYMDAANVDLKAFSEQFYVEYTSSHLQPVLETLKWLKNETDVWFEITNLLIPRANDDPDQIRRMCDWILENLGPDVPVHFTAFHPDFRLLDRPPTPHSKLIEAREIALEAGIHYVYVGNVLDTKRESTYCASCGRLVIERLGYNLGTYALHGNRCAQCGAVIPGRFDDKPGDWGNRRLPVDMRRFAKKSHWDALAEAVRSATEALKKQQTDDPSGQTQEDASSDPPVGSGQSDEPGGPQRNQGRDDPPPTADLAGRPQTAGAESPAASSQRNATGAVGRPNRPAGPPTHVELTEKQKQLVFQAAAELVRAAVCKERANPPDLNAHGIADVPVSGVFVSLKRHGHLRSCCGSFGHSVPLADALHEAAYRTATNDPRFPPVTVSELPYLDVEVWLLFAPERVAEKGRHRIRAVTVGRHGLQIIRGQNRGLLLPGVPVEHGWDAEQFLNQVCVKAGLPTTAWQDDDTVLFRFQGEAIRGRISVEPGLVEKPFCTPDELQKYVQYCRNNISALRRGATPSYYATGVSDGNVNGVFVLAVHTRDSRSVSAWRLSLKNTLPLQSTLFGLSQDLAQALQRRGWNESETRVDVAIAYATALHGTAADPDLRGLDPKRRAVVVMERSRSAVVFDPSLRPEQLLNEAKQAARLVSPEYIPVYSLAVQATCSRFSVTTAPRPSEGAELRPPAVAGTFYPGTPDEVRRMVDQLLDGQTTRRPCTGVLVPHAGWRFSGCLAAETLKRVEFPRTVIAFGPKHTPPGVDWAVAPHHRWAFPGGSLDSDPELARRLAEAVPELELDAAAHQYEHSIEVQIPFIARLAPKTRVVGVTIGGGTLERCERCAERLAQVLSELDEPPLLLISTDMSHYVSEDEARRLDALALEKLDQLDPDGLFTVVRQHRISMCGVLPAVIVLKTLQRMGRLRECEPVGYTTSAEASGDRSRVVGYAGRIFR